MGVRFENARLHTEPTFFAGPLCRAMIVHFVHLGRLGDRTEPPRHGPLLPTHNTTYRSLGFFPAPAPPPLSSVGRLNSGFAGLASSGLTSFPSPAFFFASCGSLMFGSNAASSWPAATSSVPDLAYSFDSVLIWSRSSCADLCGFGFVDGWARREGVVERWRAGRRAELGGWWSWCWWGGARERGRGRMGRGRRLE